MRRARLLRRAAEIVAVLVAAVACSESSAPSAPPTRLADTGLYADFATKVVRADVLAFTPQYPLWTDGAAKRRWIHLPEGASIDASDVDAWSFPVGTKLWKEFAWERRVETRYMERLADGSWMFASYRWTADESDAVLAPERGVRAAFETAPGAFHDVPGRSDCRVCHDAHGDTRVLGFSALQLSPDRDPLAPHSEAPRAGDVDLASLVASGRLHGLPSTFVARPPRIDAPTPRARAALGYLHGNCSACHNASGPLASLGLDLEVSVARGRFASVEALAVPSRFRPACAGPDALRVRPGASRESVLVARMSSRDPLSQMPPFGTRRVDVDALALVCDWIDHDLAPRPSAAVREEGASTTSTHGEMGRVR